MTADDLSAPLGQQPLKRRRKLPIQIPHVIAAALAIFLGVFVLWVLVGDDPFGGEPMVAVPINPHAATAMKKLPEVAAAPETTGTAQAPVRYEVPPVALPSHPPAAANTKTVTIIDGKTGARQEVVIPAEGNSAAIPDSPLPDQKFVEMTANGGIPKIAADGIRPAEAFARPVQPLADKPDAPRIALIIGGLGVSASATAEAITRLPGAVTLAFMPYGADVEHFAARARGEGHEILLQVPMEPFGYPDNASGPQTLMTSLTPEQNLGRLHFVMSRVQGYVGIAGSTGTRFTASEPAFAPILRETAKRGLIFVDDGSNPRSVAGRLAGADSLQFAKADVVLDSVPTPAEIDRALARLETAARERGVAVGISGGLPMTIEHIAKWAKAAESRGLLLVPITAVAAKTKPS
jgi:polysaccharide deacetylase 2 family uncharacterized protein YibQ